MLKRELIYLWYYISVQFEQIFPYWIAGMAIGSLISVFFKTRIYQCVRSLGQNGSCLRGIVIASLLGAVSPLCMYGTIPIAASFSKSGVREEWLGAFMMTSVLLNPQLVIYSAALGPAILMIRVVSCLLCGITAGILLCFFRGSCSFFDFEGFREPANRDVEPKLWLRFFKNLGRNFRATGAYFFVGILLSALFQRYVPAEFVTAFFGENEAFGVLMAATLGVPLYACGGATIPLLQGWLLDGMSLGSAAAFMLTGPATKITNLGAVKIVMGTKHFCFYLAYIMVFAFLTGAAVNLIF